MFVYEQFSARKAEYRSWRDRVGGIWWKAMQETILKEFAAIYNWSKETVMKTEIHGRLYLEIFSISRIQILSSTFDPLNAFVRNWTLSRKKPARSLQFPVHIIASRVENKSDVMDNSQQTSTSTKTMYCQIHGQFISKQGVDAKTRQPRYVNEYYTGITKQKRTCVKSSQFSQIRQFYATIEEDQVHSRFKLHLKSCKWFPSW